MLTQKFKAETVNHGFKHIRYIYLTMMTVRGNPFIPLFY